ncbi:glycosyltransferase family 2 protein [uncultured Roseivirga sp.]|uniref:glycosyltransferase family 2 protein n=1 Tax=uncultured Roseivirga sp. TaxID=543088 RepID=UPI000D797468|nr:glycosyltransferase family 2 protein [uncultured Roseivirga sp.]PWL31609.1 MAG: dTDP-Rha--alpha-D-GlcNAc-pyrophosphate polyprenol alpha-3-L-rhamnosyltransferase [Roseivirga sp. XM-24bin3]
MKPLVSIITVNYKQQAVTSELLHSISKLGYPNLEVIVVDNCQEGDDTLVYQSILPRAIVLNAKENLGFAGGNNLGIEKAKGDYLFLVNNDTELENGLIESLLSRFTEPTIGAVSPVLKYFSHPDKIQFAGFTPINSLTGRNELLKNTQSNSPYETPYFHGAAVMLKKEVIEKCGLMPEQFFLYYEELEWSNIIKQSGYKLLVDPAVHVLHKESISTGKNSPLKLYYQTRNRLHFMRNKGKLNWFTFVSFFLLISTPKNFLKHLLLREWKHLNAFNKGISDGLIQKKFGFRPI